MPHQAATRVRRATFGCAAFAWVALSFTACRSSADQATPLRGVVEPSPAVQGERRAPRQLGIPLGLLVPGERNAITDVDGVQVGHCTVQQGRIVNTGVTIVRPHSGNLFREKVPAAIAVMNGFGKLAGVTQIRELGLLETPIGLTSTLSVGTVTEAIARWTLALPGNERIRSVNAVVGETNDGYLHDIRNAHIRPEHVLAALAASSSGPVAQGTVGAGTGTSCFGWKGGIGTSSRTLPPRLGGSTVGVLVQANFGGLLTIAGIPVGRELSALPYGLPTPESTDGSCMIVIATDASLDARQLERLARRAFLGLARVGSWVSNGSGDYAIAFTSAESMRNGRGRPLPDSRLSPLFLAVVEATEEAVLNALFLATRVEGHRGAREALPVDTVMTILRRHRIVPAR
ncbi:MAG: aminopeptidase [Deltaproteobacteria bacterium]|nr:aminopeptidase [Deltaproteobacteria bacterium]